MLLKNINYDYDIGSLGSKNAKYGYFYLVFKNNSTEMYQGWLLYGIVSLIMPAKNVNPPPPPIFVSKTNKSKTAE